MEKENDLIKVALVSNWNDVCGIAEYARNLTEHSDMEQVSYKIIVPPFSKERIKHGAEDCDIVHFNYSSRLFLEMFMGDFQNLRKEMSQPWVITLHESSDRNTKLICDLKIFDSVVTHEKFEGATHIPLGYLPVDIKDVKIEQTVGFAGFPFPWKGFYSSAKAAATNGLKFFAIIPNSKHVRANIAQKLINEVNPNSTCYFGWWPQETVVNMLASCLMTAFAYNLNYEDQVLLHYPVLSQIKETPGISGAVRFGIAAKRPLIVTHHNQFRDLEDYQDEVYFVDTTVDETVAKVLADISNGCEKKPKRLLADMNWNKCSKEYLDVYKRVMNRQEVA